MTGLILAIFTALFESLKDVASKKNLENVDEYVVAWSLRAFALPFLLPLLLFIKIPQIQSQFWVALVIGGTLNLLATILYMKAIKHSDLSITIPMITFTPLFLLLTSPIILGEFPRAAGLTGILLIVAGSYILNIQKRSEGITGPFKALIKEEGPKLMLLVSFIWSITANIDKVGIQGSSAIFWVVAVNLFLTVGMLPIMLYKSSSSLSKVSREFKSLLPVGLFSAIGLTFQMIAISLTLVAYVISIKRTSAFFSVLFGHFLFKEKNVKERLVGAAVMIVGVLLITLA